MRFFALTILGGALISSSEAFQPLVSKRPASSLQTQEHPSIEHSLGKIFRQTALSTIFVASVFLHQDPAYAGEGEFKINAGGASTLQSGRTISITRGVNLDDSDFSGQNLKGVAFQQSIVRNANFQGSNLVGASFFDATLDGSNFEGADMSLANVEMAQFNRASLKNAIMKEMYVSGSTLFEGVKDIEGSDWTDT